MADHVDGRTPGEQPNSQRDASAKNYQDPVAPAALSRQIEGPVVSEGFDAVDGRPDLGFPVVGIGASAGGIQAYLELFENLPSNTGMAFVVVTHLSAEQKTQLPEILSRQAAMPVTLLESGTVPEPNCVYVAPPKTRVYIENGVFHIDPQRFDTGQRPIDAFFHSLANAQRNRAVGVVLSGMDADGALGLKAIKAEGGITMVQSPESARFQTMPQSSISADHVDIIARPVEIAIELGRLGAQFGNPELRRLEAESPTDFEDQQFARIVALLRSVDGVNFRLYKPSTIRRRIARRMLMRHIDTLSEYVQLLQSEPKELRDLHEDALINLTRFFRDPEVFETLKTQIWPQLFEGRDLAQQVRIWVAGCSSGEEVYSIAISLLEYFTSQPFEPPIQIFGTDASEQNIQKGRLGVYPETINSEVSPERLRRFFTRTEKGFAISKRVRDLCIFARQNLSYDPPFSRLDLISCRNVLIYFGAELQKQLFPMFHYALRPSGFLLLGISENIHAHTDLFVSVDRKQKIYSRLGGGRVGTFIETLPARILPPEQIHKDGIDRARIAEDRSGVELQRAADRIVIARYGPPGVVVNERLEILQARGHTGPFLEMPPGAPSLGLERMARQQIAPQLISAVRRAVSEGLPVTVSGLKSEGEIAETNVEVIPIQSISPRARGYLILFVPSQRQKDTLEVVAVKPAEPLTLDEKDRLIAQLQHDASSIKLYLQSLLEERDGKNQELVSANEEIQSANEELQSTNEELETAKEELQSSNEELQTVNEELQNRNAILTEASNDLSNLLNSVNLPVLMLTEDFNIRHFTPQTQRVMNVRNSDLGRPFGEIRINLETDDLQPLFADVLDTLAPRELEVQDREGHWYLLRIRPYRTTDNKIEGLVVVLVDIDQLRRSQHELLAARDFATSVVKGIPLPLVVLDSTSKIRSTNAAFSDLTALPQDDLEGRFFPDLAAVLWGMEESVRGNLKTLRAGSGQEPFLFEHRTPNGKILAVRGCILQPDGEQFVLVTFEDISAHKEVERLLRLERERLTREVESTAKALGRTQEESRALTASLFTSQEDERRRVARELHDDVSQRIAALEIDASRIEQELDTDGAKAGQAIGHMRATLAQLSRDVRQMSHRLHPAILEDLGLAPALKSLVEEFGRREQMIVSFAEESVPPEIPLEVGTNLYRIAQEALRNVSKHAGKTHVKVSLTGNANSVQLEICDFGDGFDAPNSRTGLGLIAMEERARLIHGTLRVESRRGQGTKILVDAPLPPPR